MLKNKYVAAVLVVIAVILGARAIISLTKSNVKSPQIRESKPAESIRTNLKQNVSPIGQQSVTTGSSILGSQTLESEEPVKTILDSVDLNKKVELQRIEDSALDNEWGKDPFFLPETKEVSVQKVVQTAPQSAVTLNISGILIDRNRRLVLINGEIYKAGDSIDGVLIKSIFRDKIIIEVGGIEETIGLFEKKK
ncbi:MAG: hypothetical protein AB1410_09405 [Acidobacteriota bacterium]